MRILGILEGSRRVNGCFLVNFVSNEDPNAHNSAAHNQA